jgi:hypothetical protein
VTTRRIGIGARQHPPAALAGRDAHSGLTAVLQGSPTPRWLNCALLSGVPGESRFAISKALLPSRRRRCELCANVCAGFDARLMQAFENVKQASDYACQQPARLFPAPRRISEVGAGLQAFTGRFLCIRAGYLHQCKRCLQIQSESSQRPFTDGLSHRVMDQCAASRDRGTRTI